MVEAHGLNQPQLDAATLDRDDVVLWISLFCLVVLCGLALWALLRL